MDKQKRGLKDEIFRSYLEYDFILRKGVQAGKKKHKLLLKQKR